ncbi:alanine--tRNA ligase, chloroplastic/mitochondrial-like isoform X2 [Phragmites australis]|uniref:alanine--tRNA ligase, chloroplastic/mitochondrial-like isoform X2 n=1 Tax=Phragmites australis TaxID=29695 RepID=UPI002D78FFB7|nr:alanine--tRNA ligase, chloroplastic/mitochondrial-like isoform X2 [Phragmites australis]
MEVAARPLPLLSTAPAHRLRLLLLPPRPVSGRRLRPSPGPRGFGCVGDGWGGRHSARKKGFIIISSSSASVEPATQEVGAEGSSGEWSGDAIRRRFLDFYAARGHKILPSSSLVPDDPTVFLTIAGMLQFKPIFLGNEPRRVPCATTSQKCIRTNDIENVGRTARHQTFFEMLGNFSFGDYFKKEATAWAWELATKEYGLPTERLWISVFEDDDEAFFIWHNEVGVPKERIKRMGADDNFWTSGATGPCGPCSEIYYDFYPERGSSDADLGDDSRFIEFYNLVFMQYNKKDDGSLEPLKQKNIDTGMGLERMARILQKVPNNYETDLIFPIIEKAGSMAMVSYAKADDATKTNLKIIGDHMRAVVYLISDGVIPSNIGRGYVVRRLIRRVVRMGRLIGIKGDGHGNSEGAFLPSLAEVVISLSTEIDPDVESRRKSILGELQREELRFVQTLERGEKLLDELLDEALLSAGNNGKKPSLSGKDVFLLYDTYGFPVEITAEIAGERGVTVDMKGFDIEMENQRKQSQAAHNVVKLSVGNGTDIVKSIPDTEFLGYDSLFATAVVKGLLVNGDPVNEVLEGSEVEILLDRTPFYAESGGQVGDNGFLYVNGGEDGKQKAVIEIKDVQKSLGNIFVHKGTIKLGSVEVGKEIDASVDTKLRQGAKAHHTATHLLQSALKSVVGSETSQAGSLVAFDRLRFDFNFHRPLSEEELLTIESLVNQWIGAATQLETKVMALQDAKIAGAIAMFGEKYGEQVRVVEVPGVSMELCGGTHVSNTAEIRGFKIISEQGIASGIRRIEAVAGDAFVEYVCARDNYMRHLCSSLKVKAEDVNGRVETILEELRTTRNEVSSLRSKIAVLKAASLASKATTVAPHNVRIMVENMGDVDADGLKSAAEYLVETMQDPAAVILGSSPGDSKVNLVAAFSPGVVKMGMRAGNFVGGIAKLCGGGGGGKPNFAQAGGRKPENLPDALEKARAEIVAAVSSDSS